MPETEIDKQAAAIGERAAKRAQTPRALPKVKKQREYLDRLGNRFRMVPEGTAQHHPEYIERIVAEAKGELKPYKRPAPKHTIPIPARVAARTYKYAIELLNIADISASFGVAETTFNRWRKDDPAIDQAIARARKRKTYKVVKAVEAEASDGNMRACELWMRWFRKDLDAQNTPGGVNVNLQLNVIPPAQDAQGWLEQQGAPGLIEQSDAQQNSMPILSGRPAND